MDNNFHDALKFQAILQVPSLSLPRGLAFYMVHMYLEFVGRRTSRPKWIENFHEVALAMSYIVADWICIFLTSQILKNLCKKCSFVCDFRQPYVHDIDYIIILQFLRIFQVERRADMWSSNLLVGIAQNLGVQLADLRNEASKNPSELTSCLVSTSDFDAKYKKIEKDNGRFNFFEVICTLLDPPFHTIGFTSTTIDLPKKIQKWKPFARTLP